MATAMTEFRPMLVLPIVIVALKKLELAIGNHDLTMPGNSTRRDLEDIREMVIGMADVLRDGEKRPVSEQAVQEWLIRLEDAAFQIWALVDDVLLFQVNEQTPISRMLPFLAVAANSSARKIKKIKATLKMVAEQSQSFEFGRPPAADLGHRGTTSLVVESAIIGRDEEKESIVNLLLSATSASHSTEQGPVILPIVGMGGIGKTTLAQLLFSDNRFRNYNRIWVCVSENFDLMKIRESISSQLLVESNHTESESDQDKQLGGGKVFVVLDDLWEDDSSSLEGLKHILHVDMRGSEVIVVVTTRFLSVAHKICTIEPYRIRRLSDEMCWAVMKQIIGFERRFDDQEKMNMIGQSIASKCQGIPLAAKALGYMLRYKNIEEWLAIDNSGLWNDQHQSVPENMLSAIIESYKHMPLKLRLCFGYCAIFPKGHKIVQHDLIQQWTSLDLIDQFNPVSANTLALEYITTLSQMSYLEPAKSSSTVGKDDKDAALFTMHDLVHDCARSAVDSMMLVLDGQNEPCPERNKCCYALFTNVDLSRLKLSNILSVRLRALHLLSCNKLNVAGGMFLIAKYLKVLEIRECSMAELPNSICQLKLLEYLNLSGCSGLVNLPEAFGNLINLLHVNLSGCYGINKLPESFARLEKLVYLDLSFCSCFQGIQSVLDGLKNLEHLNLSHPCCYLDEHRSHLKELKNVWKNLKNLRYLKLCMLLNPIFGYLTKTERLEYVDSIHVLENLEHLDLSHNIFLFNLPEKFGKLTNLCTLDLSGCTRLKRVAKWLNQMNHLKVVVLRNCRGLKTYQLEVRADDGINNTTLVRLDDVCSRVFVITCLEKVKCVEEAKRIKLVEKKELRQLVLGWTLTVGYQASSLDEALLAELLPPENLCFFEISGYNGACFPAWFMSSISLKLPGLVEVTLDNIPWCSDLPPLGLLPNLQKVVLRKMARIERIDIGDLSNSHRAPFPQLSHFTLDNMESLKDFNTTYWSGGKKFTLPVINELVINKCGTLRFGTCEPIAKMLVISTCEPLLMSLENKRQGHGAEDPSSSTGMAPAPVTKLVLKDLKVPLAKLNWNLLVHLPPLRSMHVINCNDLSTSEESMTILSSLKSLSFSQCDSLISLPQYLHKLTSLRDLVVDKCLSITSLPNGIEELASLRCLRIQECPELSSWCEKNKEKLVNIRELLFE